MRQLVYRHPLRNDLLMPITAASVALPRGSHEACCTFSFTTMLVLPLALRILATRPPGGR